MTTQPKIIVAAATAVGVLLAFEDIMHALGYNSMAEKAKVAADQLRQALYSFVENDTVPDKGEKDGK